MSLPSQKLNGLDKDLKIILVIFSLMHYKFSKIKFHNTLMRIIKKLSYSYKLKGSLEFTVYYNDYDKNSKRKGSIDVVWWEKVNEDGKYKPVAFFEIDSSFRRKTVYKLIYVKNKFNASAFWLYYGNKKSIEINKNLINLLNENNIILITYKKLYFPSNFKKIYYNVVKEKHL